MPPDQSNFTEYGRAMSRLAAAGLAATACDGTDEPEVWRDAWPQPWQLSSALPAAACLLVDEHRPNWAFDAFVAGFMQIASRGARFRDQSIPPTVHQESGACHPVYLPLVVHLHLAAFARHYEQMPMSQWGRCEDRLIDVLELVRSVEQYAASPPPPALLPLVIWQTLCLFECARLSLRDVDLELIDSIVHGVLSVGQDDGPFHPAEDEAGALDSADWILAERAGLHGLANLALHRRNRRWAGRVQEIVRWHQEHLDGAEAGNRADVEPWALFARFWSPQTRPGVLDTFDRLSDKQPNDWLSILLLADAAYAFGVFA